MIIIHGNYVGGAVAMVKTESGKKKVMEALTNAFPGESFYSYNASISDLSTYTGVYLFRTAVELGVIKNKSNA